MERHLHMNIIMAFWMLVFFVVVINLAKYLLVQRWHVPGVSELVANV
jgi:hypothetical protein